ncbi:hypothetical protein [Pseudomonas fluorescens]|uniref:hypothetical protein n=1 Tax=Pseudomonas TaxID=286 RepID=UPI003CFD8EE4
MNQTPFQIQRAAVAETYVHTVYQGRIDQAEADVRIACDGLFGSKPTPTLDLGRTQMLYSLKINCVGLLAKNDNAVFALDWLFNSRNRH